MLLNLTDVLTTENKTEKKQFAVGLEKISYQGIEYLVKEQTPLMLVLTNIGRGKATVQGNMQLTLVLSCDRCLKDVVYTMDLEFDRSVEAPDRPEKPLTEDELDEQNFMTGYQLDIEELVNREILLCWPTKVLCREDCKGICRQCGMDLNTQTCNCDTFVPDPRMAKIKDIFCADKHAYEDKQSDKQSDKEV